MANDCATTVAERKNEFVMKWGALRGTYVYLNDHLSSHNSELVHQARQLKCESKIYSTWTQHCCICMKIHKSGQRIELKTLADLVRILALSLDSEYSDFRHVPILLFNCTNTLMVMLMID